MLQLDEPAGLRDRHGHTWTVRAPVRDSVRRGRSRLPGLRRCRIRSSCARRRSTCSSRIRRRRRSVTGVGAEGLVPAAHRDDGRGGSDATPGDGADVRALVTGAAGFAGQWLCRELLHSGWDVWGTRLDDALPARRARCRRREVGALVARRSARGRRRSRNDRRRNARRDLPPRRHRTRAVRQRRSRRHARRERDRRLAPARRRARAPRGGDARSGRGRRRQRRAVRPPRRLRSCR